MGTRSLSTKFIRSLSGRFIRPDGLIGGLSRVVFRQMPPCRPDEPPRYPHRDPAHDSDHRPGRSGCRFQQSIGKRDQMVCFIGRSCVGALIVCHHCYLPESIQTLCHQVIRLPQKRHPDHGSDHLRSQCLPNIGSVLPVSRAGPAVRPSVRHGLSSAVCPRAC